MASPRVFVSSTFYDLKYIRENVKYFIRTIGYEPVLSEEGDVFYNPKQHTHDSCLVEVPACQIFVLIIGGRYGGIYNKGDKSITNMEYEAAVTHKIPVFALVEASVYAEHKVYNENLKNNKKVKIEDITYPSVDNIKVFEFIDSVRRHAINNSIVPFRDFTDIESYLKKQWAGMMYSFLNDTIIDNRVADTLSEIAKVNDKIEVLTTQILSSVGKNIQIATVQLYEAMTANESYRVITYFYADKDNKVRIKVTPGDILASKDFLELSKRHNVELKVLKSGGIVMGPSGEISKSQLNVAELEFASLKKQFASILEKFNLTPDKYLSEQNANAL